MFTEMQTVRTSSPLFFMARLGDHYNGLELSPTSVYLLNAVYFSGNGGSFRDFTRSFYRKPMCADPLCRGHLYLTGLRPHLVWQNHTFTPPFSAQESRTDMTKV